MAAALAGIERVVERPVRVEPADKRARRTVERREQTAHDDPAVRLDQDRTHGIVRAHRAAERRVHRAVGIQARDMAAIDAGHRGEIPADDDLAVGLDRDGIDISVRSHAGIERRIHHPVGAEARDEVPRLAADGGEQPADQHAPIGLQRERVGRIVRATARIERGVQRAIRIQPRDARAVGAVDHREQAGHEHLAVRLQRQRPHGTVDPALRVERRIEIAIHINAGDPVARDPVEIPEIPADDDLLIGLQDRGVHKIIPARRRVEGRVHRTRRHVERLVVDDGERRLGRCAQRRTLGIGEIDDDGLVAVQREVVDELNREIAAELPVFNHERAIGEVEVRAGTGRAAGHRIVHQRLAAHPAGAADGQDGAAPVFIGVVNRRGERDRAGKVVVQNRHLHVGRQPEHSRQAGRDHAGIGQDEVEDFGAFRHGVVEDRHRDGFRRGVARGPAEGSDGRAIVQPRERGVVGGVIIHRDRADAAAGADDAERDAAGGLADRRRVRHQTEPAWGEVVVVNHQRRQRRQHDGIQHRPAHRIRQAQKDRLVALRRRVVHDRHGERPAGDAAAEGQRPARGHVVEAREGRPVGRRIIHRHGPDRPVGPQHGDDRHARVFIDGKRGRREPEHPVLEIVVDEREPRARRPEGHAQRDVLAAEEEHIPAIGLAQSQVEYLVALDPRIVPEGDDHRGVGQEHEHVGDDTDEDAIDENISGDATGKSRVVRPLKRFAEHRTGNEAKGGNPRRGAHQRGVVQPGLGRPGTGGPVLRREGRRRLAQAPVGAGERDKARAAIFIKVIGRLRESDVARTVDRAADDPREIVARVDFIPPEAPAHAGETAADDQVPVRLEGERVDEFLRLGADDDGQPRELIVRGVHEPRVERAIRAQLRQTHAPGAVETGEQPARNQWKPRLLHQCEDRTIKAAARIKRGIDGAVRVQPGDRVPAALVHGGKRAAEHDLLRAGRDRLRNRGDDRCHGRIVTPRRKLVRIVPLIHDDANDGIGGRTKRDGQS